MVTTMLIMITMLYGLVQRIMALPLFLVKYFTIVWMRMTGVWNMLMPRCERNCGMGTVSMPHSTISAMPASMASMQYEAQLLANNRLVPSSSLFVLNRLCCVGRSGTRMRVCSPRCRTCPWGRSRTLPCRLPWAAWSGCSSGSGGHTRSTRCMTHGITYE